MSEPVNPHSGPPSPDLFPRVATRPQIGPRFDKFLEFLRQCNRPALGLVCLVALADQFLFAQWFRAGAGRLDIGVLILIVFAALLLAGLRGFELGAFKAGTNGAPA